jgi:hypothetical protein
MQYEEYKKKVIKIATEMFKGNLGNRGVCIDSLKNSFERNLSVDDAADRIYDDTLYWNGYFHLMGR